MNVVVLGNACGYGGAQTAFRQLIEFFLAKEFSVGAVGLVGRDDSIPGMSRLAFAAAIDYRPSSHLRKIQQILGAARAARRHKPDIFISVGLAKSSCMLAHLMPSYTFCLAQDFIYGRQVDDRLLAATGRAFDALAVQAPSMVAALQRKGYASLPINWLPCFPDPPHLGFTCADLPKRGIARLAYFGRLASNKGIDLLLEALAIVRQHVEVTLDIWGTGEEDSALRSLAKTLPIADSVRFCGHYPRGQEYAALMCSYDGLVLTSTGLEGLPLVLLEAMAHGVPFITTNIGAIPDCCVNNPDAILVEPTVEDICAGIKLFARRSSENDFSVERLIRHYQLNFSHDAMSARWKSMLANPKEFFSS